MAKTRLKTLKNAVPVLLAILVLLAQPAVFSNTASALAGGAPVAVAANPKFEFSPVLEGKQVTHDFVIRNKGASVLAIKKIHTG